VPDIPDDHDLAIAAFRHRVLAEALDAERDELGTILRARAGQPRTDPEGRGRTVSVRTLVRWLAAYRRGGFLALCPKRRQDQGALRAIPPDVFARAQALRREKHSRPTKTILDILVRQKKVARGEVARSTLDRHLAAQGLSRHTFGSSSGPSPRSRARARRRRPRRRLRARPLTTSPSSAPTTSGAPSARSPRCGCGSLPPSPSCRWPIS
jgi:hypothetical protein